MEQVSPQQTFSAPGRYPEYFLGNEDFLSTKSSQTMDYEMESKVLSFEGCRLLVHELGWEKNRRRV